MSDQGTIKVGVVGLGSIGKTLCVAAENMQNIQLAAVYDEKIELAREFASSLKCRPPIIPVSKIIKKVDLIVECASQEAVLEIVIPALEARRDVMIMSVGALIDDELLERIKILSESNNCKVYLPSGAISGLDGLKSAAIGRVTSVTLTTRKPPFALKSTPYLEEKGIDLDSITEKTILFEGCASKAVKLFPANVNVSASLSLAGIGPKETTVKIVADPSITKNIHEIEVKGEFGEFSTIIKNVPSPSNPKTSYLASLSAIATLKNIPSRIKIGT